MIIQHNMCSMFADRNLKINTEKNSKRMERLSSGYRINRAADDAAGLCISEKMRAIARGLKQDVRNVRDGASVCQVADGALAEVHSMLHRISELSVQAANDTNTDSDRMLIQQEIDDLKLEVNRISTDTEFNTIKIFKPTNTPDITGRPTDILVFHEDFNGGTRDAGILYNGKRYAYGSPELGVEFDKDGNIAAGEYILKAEGENGQEVQIPLIFEGGDRRPSARKYVLDPQEDGIYIDGIQHPWSTIKQADGTAFNPNDIKGGTYSFKHAGLTFTFEAEDGIDLDSLRDGLKADGLTTYSLRSGSPQKVTQSINPYVAISDIEIDKDKQDYIPRSNTSNDIPYGYRMKVTGQGIQMYLPSQYNANQGSVDFDFMSWEALGLSEWMNGDSVNPDSSVSGGERPRMYTYKDSMTGISINFTVDSEVSKGELMKSIANWEITVTTNSKMEFGVNSSGTGTTISAGSHSSSLDAYGTQCDLLGRDAPDQLTLQSGMGLVYDTAADELSFTMQDANGKNYKFSASNAENGVKSTVDSKLRSYISSYASSYASYLNRTQGGTGGPDYVSSGYRGELTFNSGAYWLDMNYTMDFSGWLNNSNFDVSYTENPVTHRRTYTVTAKAGLETSLASKKNTLVGNICNALKNTNVSVKTDDGTNLAADMDIDSREGTENIRYGSQLITGDREMMIQAGPHSQQAIEILLPAMNAAILGISGIDVTSHSSASAAITSAAKAVEKISEMRSHFGATQNRLEHAMAVNQINAENTTASESRLRDADMAKEMVEHAKYNILIEAGQSILVQANHSPEEIIRGLLQ